MITDVDFALLAPVPLAFLESGLEVCTREGFVAYGSRKWELFVELDRLRAGGVVPVLIYPSYEDDEVKLAYEICWTGSYTGHVRAPGGIHPEKMRYRPDVARQYPTDMSGYWAIYWHVSELKRLPDGDWRPISSLRSHKSGKFWKAGSPPRGPEIVERPSWI